MTDHVNEQDKAISTPDAPAASTDEQGGAGFIAKWAILLVCALIITFLGRFLGFEGNPLSFHTAVFALFTAVMAVICIASGLFVLFRGVAQRRALTKRNGIMLVLFGVFMLGGFFIFKSVVSLVFG